MKTYDEEQLRLANLSVPKRNYHWNKGLLSGNLCLKCNYFNSLKPRLKSNNWLPRVNISWSEYEWAEEN